MWSLRREFELERELELRRARRSFEAFCLYVLPEFKTHWHIKLIAKAIDEIADGKLHRMYLAVPPQHGKSTLCSVLAPAYWLGRNPDVRIVSASYAANLSTSLNRQVQRIMESQRYRDVFPATCITALGDKAQGSALRTQSAFEVQGHRGFLRSVGTLGSATGFSAEIIVIDDAHKNMEEAESAVVRERVWSWFQTVMMTRLQKNGALVCLGTRWRTDDFLASVLAQAVDEAANPPWRIMSLPALAEGERAPYDPREEGQALWDERFDQKTLAERRVTVGERVFQALYQQQPAPESNAFLKPQWFKWYDELPGDLTDWTMSADLTFEDKSDYTAIGVFARQGANHYLIDMIEQRLDFTGQLQLFESLSRKYPQAHAKIVENAANGAALIATLQKRVPGIISIRQKTSKENRVMAASPVFEAGNFYLPRAAKWVDRYVVQMTTFPSAAHDDMLDSTITYLLRAQQRTADYTKLRGFSLARADSVDWRR